MQNIEKHLNELMNFYPATDNRDSVRALLEYCQQILTSTGSFNDCEILVHNGVSSLYASTQDTKSPRLLLHAHVDVVAANPSLRKLVKSQGKYIGRGVYDMLYGTACYLSLLEEIKDELPNMNIGVMLGGDEEHGGFNSTAPLVKQGYSADVVFLPDAGEGLGTLNSGSKGVYIFNVTVSGKAHHGSRPWEGDGAGNKLVAALGELTATTTNQRVDPFTLVVSGLSGGDAINKGPAEATACLDVRYVDKAALAKFKKQLNRVLAKYDGKVISQSEGPAFNLNLDDPLVKEFLKLYPKYTPNGSVEMIRTDGSSDARFFAANNTPVIMLRPKGGGAHGDDEWVDQAELNKFYELLREYTLKIAKI